MKKYIIKSGLLFFATFLFLSCNDEFLERYPLNRISNETFWNTENDLRVYNNSIYNIARDNRYVSIIRGHESGSRGGYYSFWYLDGFADNYVMLASRQASYAQIRSGKHTVQSGSRPWGGYSNSWNFVRACNVGFDNYQKANLPQVVIDKYAGEARMLRGWFYYEKVNKFGDAPWVDHELNIDSEELFAARTPRDEVMANVLADLTFACEKLPNDWGDGNAPGRLNRWCALLLKSRVCLFEGTWQKYHGGSNANMWFQQAADAAKDLMDNGPYSLYVSGDPLHDYNAIHRIEELAGNPEVMYYRKYERGLYPNSVQDYLHRYVFGATKSMVEDYLCTDGLPITLSPLYKGDAVFEDVFENRDPRLRQTILHPADVPYYVYNNYVNSTPPPAPYPKVRNKKSSGLIASTGYNIIKVYNNDAQFAAYNTSITPAIVFRFGEALLNYAEAKAELGNISQGDLDISINKLRDRVGMVHMTTSVAMDPRNANDGVSALISEIRRERRVELFMEGFRYDDLRRWKQGKKLESLSLGMRWDDAAKARLDPDGTGTILKSSLVNGIPYLDPYQGTDWDNPVFDESKHYLWPIPTGAISQNTNIAQNPGWD